MAKDYYKTLGVEKSATTEEIKKAYKNLAKKYHPDVNKETNSSEKFKEVNEAAAILGNTEKRKKYDEYGTAEPGQDFGGFNYQEYTQGFDFDDIFDSFFSGMGGQGRNNRRRGPRRGRDLLYEESITLEDAA